MRGSAHHLLNWLPVQRCLPAGPHSQPQGQMPGAQQPAPSSPVTTPSPPLSCPPGGAASCGHSFGASETTSTCQTKS